MIGIELRCASARIVSAIGSTSDEAWTAEYPFDPDDLTLGDRIGYKISGQYMQGTDWGYVDTAEQTDPAE